jgi:hypothetical protein
MTRKAATNMTMPTRQIYGADGVDYTPAASGQLAMLTTHPAAEHIDIDADGKVVGLS